jgi:CelD/BcsL family acetyltransferase involved in cellulose biosynthesis
MSAAYEVSISKDWPATRERWARSPASMTCGQFQTLSWLDAWYTSYAGQGEPVLVDVAHGGDVAVRLAFVVTQRGAQRVLVFADLGVSDFNAPILGPAAPTTAADAMRLWRAVVAALPNIDLIDLRKMPSSVGERANPLALLDGTAKCPMTGHLVDVADWDAYHSGLDRRVRMELERSWRVFQRHPEARFERVRDAAQAMRTLDVMDQQQRARMTEAGQPFLLDRPAEAALYRHDLARRLAAGEVVISVLMAGADIVATAYAVSNGSVPALVRISNAGGVWTKASPGRLIVHQTLHHLAAEGFPQLDLSVGDYDYKRRFGPRKTPLFDLVSAVSWRGRTSALRHRAVDTLRRHPRLEARLRRLLGKADPTTGRIPDSKSGGA